MPMVRLILAAALLLTACSQNSDHVHKLMRQCYDDLRFNDRPFSCEDALKAYHGLDMEKVDPWKRVELRFDEAAIAKRMRTGE